MLMLKYQGIAVKGSKGLLLGNNNWKCGSVFRYKVWQNQDGCQLFFPCKESSGFDPSTISIAYQSDSVI